MYLVFGFKLISVDILGGDGKNVLDVNIVLNTNLKMCISPKGALQTKTCNLSASFFFLKINKMLKICLDIFQNIFLKYWIFKKYFAFITKVFSFKFIHFTCSLNVKAYKMDFLGDITSITVGNYETVYIQYIQMFLKRERS